MAWLQFGGASGPIVEVQVQGPRVNYERIGQVHRTYSGRLRSQVKAVKKVWEGDTPPLTWSDADAILTEVGIGITTVLGIWPGQEYTVDIEITGDVPIKDPRELTTDARRVLSFRATEDAPV